MSGRTPTKTPVPEDLSHLPDAAPESPEDAPAVRAPEDVSALPDAALPEPAEDLAAEAEPGPRRPARLAWAAVLALAALALAAMSLQVASMVETAFALNYALGWTVLALAGTALALVAAIAFREVRGYLRLGAFERMREAGRRLAAEPRDHEAGREFGAELTGFLDYLEGAGDAAVLDRVESLRERMDLADDPVEWLADADRVVVSPLDEETWELIRREAVNVGLATAISPSGFVDAIIALWRNLRLIRGIAGIYRVRAGAYGTFVIMRRAVAAVVVADLAQEATALLLGAGRSFASLLGGPLAQGMANATMTILVGLKAQEQCRPLALADERKRGTARMLAGSVTSAMRRVVPGKGEGGDEGD